MHGDSAGRAFQLERLLLAPTERVFAACVEPDMLARWWGPAGFSSPSLELNVRVGGRYRIKMQPPDGEAFHLRGEFREIDPPRRLAYTFVWEEPDPDDQETLVTLSFLEDKRGTRLVVEQGPFATEARHALHLNGWIEGLDRLRQILE